MPNKKKSVSFVLSCIVLWAFIPVVSRLGQQNLDNYQFLFWSSALSLIVLFASLCATGKANAFRTYSRKDFAIALGLGFLGTFLYYLLLYFGYAHLQGLEVLVIQYTWPIFIVLFSVVLLKEKLTLRNSIAACLGFLGVFIVLTKGNIFQIHFSNAWIDAVVLLAAAVFGLFSVLSKKYSFEPFSATVIFFLSAAICSFFSMLIFSKFALPSESSWIPILVNGIFINGFSYILWLKALAYGKASFVAPFVFLTPVLAAILIVLFFGEAFLSVYAIGLGLTIVAGLITA